MRPETASVKLSIRLDLPNGTRFGPGKAALLAALQETKSISGAAACLGMSYPRAQKLIEQMNDAFSKPLVQTQHGGKSGGGTYLTAEGEEALSIYNQICRAASAGSQIDLNAVQKMLAPIKH